MICLHAGFLIWSLALTFVRSEVPLDCDLNPAIENERIQLRDCETTLKNFTRQGDWIHVQELAARRSCGSCHILFESKSHTGIAIPFGAARDAAWNIIKNCAGRGGSMTMYQGIGLPTGQLGQLTMVIRDGSGETCPVTESNSESKSDSTSDSDSSSSNSTSSSGDSASTPTKDSGNSTDNSTVASNDTSSGDLSAQNSTDTSANTSTDTSADASADTSKDTSERKSGNKATDDSEDGEHKSHGKDKSTPEDTSADTSNGDSTSTRNKKGSSDTSSRSKKTPHSSGTSDEEDSSPGNSPGVGSGENTSKKTTHETKSPMSKLIGTDAGSSRRAKSKAGHSFAESINRSNTQAV